MITVEEVRTRRQRRDFLRFPLRLYRGNPNFVPPLYGDERKIFRKNYLYYDTCEAVYYNAYKDGVMAGRISGILQKAANEKSGERRIRFTRFDVVDDFEVARALFNKVEEWGRAKGMDTVCGPLGFSDLEREGLLIDGFDQMSTFEEQYNAPYYKEYIERLGYAKEVDWTESQLRAPAEGGEDLAKMAEFILRRYKLHIGTARSVRDFLNKYADPVFEILDRSYAGLYGTVPFTEGMKRLMISNFKLIIDLDHVVVVLDEEENLVLMAVCFPSIARAVQKSEGRLTPGCIVRILRALRHPKVIDLALIGVEPLWLNRGISSVVAAELVKMLQQPGTEYAETNLNLEDNYAIQNLWKRFDAKQHKKRRSYIKKL